MTTTAVITGASSGIGHAVARRLHADGMNVMLAARRADRIESLTDELGERAAFHVTDVTDRSAVEALVAATDEAFGQVDVLVNNAGVMPISPLAMRRVDDWNQMIDVNIRGVLHGIDAVLQQMIGRKEGHIINVSSVAGHKTSPGTSVYSATKYSVRAISEGLRQEMAPLGVRVSVVSPGAVQTELGDSITVGAIRDAIAANLDFEFLDPGDIADAVAWVVGQPPNVCVSEVLIRPTGQVI